MLLPRQLRVVSFLMFVLSLIALGACDVTTPTPIIPNGSVTPALTMVTATPTKLIGSQTLEEVTIGVQSVKADAHRITLTMSVDGPSKPHAYLVSQYPPTGGVRDSNNLPSLAIDDKALRRIEGASQELEVATRAGEPLHGQVMVVFDASWLPSMEATVPLRLTMPLYVDDSFVFPPTPLPAPVPTSEVPVEDTHTLIHLPTRPPALLPFALSLTVPFKPQRTIIKVGQTVKSNDVDMTLEQIDITLSEARIRLRYTPTKADTFLNGNDWVAYGGLSISRASGTGPEALMENPEDEEQPEEPGRCNSNISNNPCFLSYLMPPFPSTNPVDCTLTVTAFRPSPSQGPWPAPPPFGTWVFHFTVPTALK